MNAGRTRTDLLRAAAAGDEAARNALLGLAAEFLARLAHIASWGNRLVSFEDAEEAANDTLLKVCRAMQDGSYQAIDQTGRHAFHRYVEKVFGRTLIDHARRNRHVPRGAGADDTGRQSFPELADPGPEPVEELIEHEAAQRRERLQAICFALAMHSIDLVRQRQMDGCRNETDAMRGQLAWRGFFMMVLERKGRDEVIARLVGNSKVGEQLSASITPNWLSKRATNIRKQLWEAFLELASALVPDATAEELMESLAEMCQQIGHGRLAELLRAASSGGAMPNDEQLNAIDHLLFEARRQLQDNRRLKGLTGKLQTRATKLSRGGTS